MDGAHWAQRRNWRTHHSSIGSGIEHQILQPTHHQARNHRQMQNVPYPARNCGTHHIRVPNTSTDQYLNRHNQVAAQLHLDICRHYGIKVEAECWYQHKPEWVMEKEKATILWDSPVITDRHVPCNKPDIVIQKKFDRCQIIDVAIPSDYNIQEKATEKMSKYVDLQIECQRLWNKKVEVIPVIIGATGIVDKNIKKYVGRIPGCHNIYSLQRSAILGTAHILRKVLSISQIR